MTEHDEAGHGKQRRQAKGVAALGLASGQPVETVAATAGVSSRTIFRWLRQPGFQRQVSRLRGRMVSEATGAMSAAMTRAAGTLTRLLDAEDGRIALAAAVKVIELCVKLRESVEIEARLAALEDRAKGQPSWH